MARKSRNPRSQAPNFQEVLDGLRTHGFELTPAKGVEQGTLVSKGGVAAVLVPGKTDPKWESGGTRMAVTPGVFIRGEIARLVDRGYQKFIKTAQFELPATADQLRAIHNFSEELNLVSGAMGLYNEALGTTSDVYQYDRLRGRDSLQPSPARPWELGNGH